jgi:nucleoside-diphosphate-sugar epimerase
VAIYTITGGAGFIGSHLVEEVLRRGHAVRVVDNLSTGRRENLPAAGAVEFIVGDVSDPAVARRAAAGATVVLHQAAIPSVPRSVEDPAASHRANVEGTLQILLAARDAGVTRVVFAGSSSIYGDAATLPKREDMRPHPLSPYALQKLVGEEYCRLFTELYGLETVVTRYFNVFGPRQNPGSPYSGVISLFIDAMLAGRSPRIYGDGEQTRDFTYIGDVVQGVLLAAERPGVAGRVLNVAAGGRVSLLNVISALQTILQTTVDPILGPPRAGDIRHSEADISEARRLLGFEPRTTFADGLRHTVTWFREQTATRRPEPN